WNHVLCRIPEIVEHTTGHDIPRPVHPRSEFGWIASGGPDLLLIQRIRVQQHLVLAQEAVDGYPIRLSFLADHIAKDVRPAPRPEPKSTLPPVVTDAVGVGRGPVLAGHPRRRGP